MLAGSLVTLYVGPMRKEYIIHQKLICSAADIFKTHFETLDTKAPVIDMHLPNHDPKAFGLFIDFLYRKTFSEVLPPTSQELSTAEMDSKKHPHEDNIDLLLNLYFMACDWGMLDLQNLSLDHTVRYLRKANDLFQRKHLVAIYGKIRAPKSPLRRFAVDHFIHANLKRSVPIRQRQKSIRERIDVDSSNFILDVFEAMLHAKRCPAPMDPMSQSKCVYHVHSDGVDCTK